VNMKAARSFIFLGPAVSGLRGVSMRGQSRKRASL
jgi:hypothetical protein